MIYPVCCVRRSFYILGVACVSVYVFGPGLGSTIGDRSDFMTVMLYVLYVWESSIWIIP